MGRQCITGNISKGLPLCSPFACLFSLSSFRFQSGFAFNISCISSTSSRISSPALSGSSVKPTFNLIQKQNRYTDNLDTFYVVSQWSWGDAGIMAYSLSVLFIFLVSSMHYKEEAWRAMNVFMDLFYFGLYQAFCFQESNASAYI